MTGESVISIENLSKDFSEVTALDSVSVDISRGIFGIIGPNGAGKTTLIRILLGLIPPDSGNANVLGYDIRTESIEIRSHIGVLHETPVFPKSMAAIDFLRDIVRIYGYDVDCENLLEQVDLLYAKNRKIGNLSAGMYQRLGIALAFAGKPQLVVLDEPTSNLDVEGRKQILNLILNLHQKMGVSFIIASHILTELEQICHEVAFIKSGRILETGKVLDILDKYGAGVYHIRTPNPLKLSKLLEDQYSVCIEIQGTSTVLVRVKSDNGAFEFQDILDLAREHGISIQGYQEGATLDDIFSEVMKR
jgi:ABC-2 type transport system ATP-binding protein